MDIKEVATSQSHRHREFAGRVLEDDLALWACFLHPMKLQIEACGGSVRPRVEFGERQARLQAWQNRMCTKFDAAPPKAPSHILANPVQDVPPVVAKPIDHDMLGLDDDFFNDLDDGALNEDFFVAD